MNATKFKTNWNVHKLEFVSSINELLLKITKSSKEKMRILDKLLGKKQLDFPPKPKWKPNLPIDHTEIVEKTKYYTGEKLQFAVFEFGTVVFFTSKVDSIEESAKSVLNKIYNSHPDMKPTAMDDGNYLVEYSQPAFTIVFKDEIEKHWNYIEKNHQDGVCRDEVLINEQGQRNVFEKVGKICLFGRTKMFLDAQNPKVIRIFDLEK